MSIFIYAYLAAAVYNIIIGVIRCFVIDSDFFFFLMAMIVNFLLDSSTIGVTLFLNLRAN